MKQWIPMLMIAAAVAACSGPEDNDTTGPGMASADRQSGAAARHDDDKDTRGLVPGDSRDDKRTAAAARDVEGRNAGVGTATGQGTAPAAGQGTAAATPPAGTMGNTGNMQARDRATAPAPDANAAGQQNDPNRYAADNSGRNVRDRDAAVRTADDQPNNQSDLTITQEIRKAVVANDNLSTNAQNVKIITENGVVTLRGPVTNAEEKATLAATAQKVAGVKRVQNEIEIATSN